MESRLDTIKKIKNKINNYFQEAYQFSSGKSTEQQKNEYFKNNAHSIAKDLDTLREINSKELQSIDHMANTAYQITPEKYKHVFLNDSLLSNATFVLDNIKDYKLYPLISEELRNNSLFLLTAIYHLNNATADNLHDENHKKIINKIYSAVPNELKNSETFKPVLIGETTLDNVPKDMFKKPDIVYAALKDAIEKENKLAILYIFVNTTEDISNFLEEPLLKSYKFLPKAIQIKEKNILIAMDYSVENIFNIPTDIQLSENLEQKILHQLKDKIIPKLKAQSLSDSTDSASLMENNITLRFKTNIIYNLLKLENSQDKNIPEKIEELEQAINLKISNNNKVILNFKK